MSDAPLEFRILIAELDVLEEFDSTSHKFILMIEKSEIKNSCPEDGVLTKQNGLTNLSRLNCQEPVIIFSVDFAMHFERQTISHDLPAAAAATVGLLDRWLVCWG